MVIWWYDSWWRNGCCCWLCNGYQHDGYKETWPFFALGFVFACVSEFTLIALGVIGVVIAIVYLGLKDAAKNSGGGSNTGSGDPLGDILNDY